MWALPASGADRPFLALAAGIKEILKREKGSLLGIEFMVRRPSHNPLPDRPVRHFDGGTFNLEAVIQGVDTVTFDQIVIVSGTIERASEFGVEGFRITSLKIERGEFQTFVWSAEHAKRNCAHCHHNNLLPDAEFCVACGERL